VALSLLARDDPRLTDLRRNPAMPDQFHRALFFQLTAATAPGAKASPQREDKGPICV